MIQQTFQTSQQLKIRILHLSKMNGISGSENHLLTLLANLDKSEFDVELCILTEPRYLPQLRDYVAQLETAGVRVFVRTMRRHLAPHLIWWLRSYIKRRHFEIVHTHLIHADFYGTIAAKLAGTPVILSSRHNDDRFRRHRALIWLNRLIARWQTNIIVISDWVGRFLQDVEGIPAEKIARIHYGLDPAPIEALADLTYVRQQFNIPADAPVIGTIGRLTAQKGHIYLLQAVSLLKKEFPNLRVIMIGDGELRSELEAHTKALDITTQVIFTGSRDHRETLRLLSGMDMFVFPSLWEGFGLVLLEAMALKKPVIASNVSAIPESVKDGETGILVLPADSQALADAIVRLLKARITAKRMGEYGRIRLNENFSVSQMVQKTAQLYNACIRKQLSQNF